MLELTNRIDALLSENKIRRADIVRGTGLSEGCIRGWYKGQVPSADALLKVAQFFDVTVEWLLTGEDDIRAEHPIFSKEERKLIEIFRHLDERDKNAVLTLAQSLESQYSNSTIKSSSAG